MKRCYDSGNKLVVVILSGRPLIIEDHLGDWDGLIAAAISPSQSPKWSSIINGLPDKITTTSLFPES